MIRGTTAQFRFKLPFPYSDFNIIEVQLWQPGNDTASITKIKNTQVTPHRDDGFVQGRAENEVCIALSSAETARFSEQMKGYAQIRAYAGGTRNVTVGCRAQMFSVYPSHSDTPLSLISDGSVSDSTENDVIFLDAGFVG